MEIVKKIMYGPDASIKKKKCHTSIIPSLRRLWQQDCEFKVENLRRQQKEIQELKTAITEMKNLLVGSKGRFQQEITEYDRWKGESLNKHGRVQLALGKNQVRQICTVKFTREETEKWLREYLKK
jgi:hypothetical protein